MPSHNSYMRNHLVLPMLLFILLATLLEFGTIDIYMADMIYQAGGAGWTLRHSYLFSEVLHNDAQALMKVLAVMLFVVAILSQFIRRLQPYRRALWYLALVMPLSGLLVGIGKEITHVDCPWDLLRFGGEHPYIRLFEPHPGDYKYGRCFPAAHASAGYTFFALYFFFSALRPAWKYYGLMIGVVLGVVFGITQQLRGAHFMSHDLWTAAICWFNSLGWYWFAFLRKKHVARKYFILADNQKWEYSRLSATVITNER